MPLIQEIPNWRFTPGALLGVLIFHGLALAAPFTFTWSGFIAFLVMANVIQLSLTLGYHRLLTHRSFQVSKPLEYFLVFLCCLALQGGPLRWIATHRLHHKASDTLEDPHLATRGFLWSHLLWNFYRHPKLETTEDLRHYAPDLYRDPLYCFLDRYCYAIYLLTALLFFLTGTWIQDWQLGLSLVIWGFALRTVYGWHVTWLVNSVTHLWGYRNHNIPDNSRNNWWVALLTFGEGWHNNHHANSNSAKLGQVWYEWDAAYGVILVLYRVGLVSQITLPHHELPAG